MENKELVRHGYNNCAQNYLKHRDLFQNQKYIDDLIDRLEPNSKILDIGCGAGIPIDKYLVEKGFQVTGIDLSSEQIRLAKENVSEAEYHIQDMSEIDFPDKSFDCVISFYAIFHVKREEHQQLFDRLFASVKDGGYLLVTMGAGEWEGVEDFFGSEMFWSHFGAEKNLEIIQNSGFQIIHQEIDQSGNEEHLVSLAQKPQKRKASLPSFDTNQEI